MRKDILDLLEAHPDAIFQIYTNGTLVTEALADANEELCEAPNKGFKARAEGAVSRM